MSKKYHHKNVINQFDDDIIQKNYQMNKQPILHLKFLPKSF